jgi:hypothetical protein
MPTTSLRPALAALAAAPRSTTVRKLWKALTPEERTAAITAALADDESGWVKTTTRVAVAGAIKFRPQTVATWPKQKLVAEAARVPLDEVVTYFLTLLLQDAETWGGGAIGWLESLGA